MGGAPPQLWPSARRARLAIAIAYKAVHNRQHGLFTTAAQLIDDLGVAADAGKFHERLKRYTAPDVLVVDEVGYLTLRDNAAHVLYHVSPGGAVAPAGPVAACEP